MNPSQYADRLIRKLETLADLSDEEKHALRGLPMTVKAFGADQDIVREGDCPMECCLVLTGMLFRYLVLDDGRRQIMGFYIPGDIPDLQSLHITIMDHSVGTLVPTTVAFIPHQSLNDVNARYPTVANALWRDTIVDAAMFRLSMVGLGRKSAHERIAHLLCELLVRFKAVGLADDERTCAFPITQGELGDALGLTTVHVNRVLRDLKRDGLVTLRGRSLHVDDWERLRELAKFDPTYLHLEGRKATE
ncbi:Crp/Fnr family transcriptional regulator [Microvirga aerophila]|uniref:Crp/Fnr family transcriptional regulator n=1 Tax=Microvirga aerophila TaxID=670291 RepID=A0A512BVM7_9HYPH|nr:Crp/Fnr family transcriptional regulator [Microvirga aerophila]GEO15990.1 Crp/Fnr family transcriptional regulator [Microvirga aerophila]